MKGTTQVITTREEYDLNMLNVINTIGRHGMNYLETDSGNEIIEDISMDNNSKSMLILLKDQNELDYTLLYEDALLDNIGAIKISRNNSSANLYSVELYSAENLNISTLLIMITDKEYLTINKDEDGESVYILTVKDIPSHFIYPISDILDKFPIIKSEDDITSVNNTPQHTTEIYGYLNPQIVEKVLLKTVNTNIDNYWSHILNVNCIIANLKEMQTIDLIDGSIIVDQHNNGIYMVENQNKYRIKCKQIAGNDYYDTNYFEYYQLWELDFKVFPPYYPILAFEDNSTCDVISYPSGATINRDEAKNIAMHYTVSKSTDIDLRDIASLLTELIVDPSSIELEDSEKYQQLRDITHLYDAIINSIDNIYTDPEYKCEELILYGIEYSTGLSSIDIISKSHLVKTYDIYINIIRKFEEIINNNSL